MVGRRIKPVLSGRIVGFWQYARTVTDHRALGLPVLAGVRRQADRLQYVADVTDKQQRAPP